MKPKLKTRKAKAKPDGYVLPELLPPVAIEKPDTAALRLKLDRLATNFTQGLTEYDPVKIEAERQQLQQAADGHLEALADDLDRERQRVNEFRKANGGKFPKVCNFYHPNRQKTLAVKQGRGQAASGSKNGGIPAQKGSDSSQLVLGGKKPSFN